MLRLVRGFSAPPHGVRLLVLSIWIAVGLLASTRAGAQPPDSTAIPAIRPPVSPPQTSLPSTTATQTPARPTSVKAKPARPKVRAYTVHLHGGLFAPIDVNATSPTLGLRLGRRVVSHVQAGLLVGWTFERKNLEQRVNSLPGLQPHRILARVDGQLVPAMVFLQVDLNETRFLVPYVGIATGYEWLTLDANDYRTDESASTTYANHAWESWGGIGMRLGEDMTLDSEIFYNGGSLERDVTDSAGESWREAVDVNGVGARVGVNFRF